MNEFIIVVLYFDIMIIDNVVYKNDKDSLIRLTPEKLSVQVLHYGFSKCSGKRPPSFQNLTSEFSFHYVFSGAGFVEYDNKPPVRVKKGDIFVFLPSHYIVYYTDKETPYSYYWITFNGEGVKDLLNILQVSAENPIISSTNVALMDKLFKEQFNQCQKYPQIAGIIAKAYLYTIIANLLKAVPNDKKNKKTTILPYIEIARTYIEENLSDETLCLEKVAKHLHLNKVYLSRIFYKNLGIKFTDYLTELRTRKAITLMDAGETRIKNIAYSVGFKSQYYFSVVFKKIVRLSPSEYVRQAQEKIKNKEKTQS